MGSKLKQILHYLDEHYTETISLDFLAEEFYISKYYLAREFKKEYGTTIIRYVLAKKITHAKELLRYSNSSIEEIARLCGMDDANSTEFDQKTTHPVISLQEEQKGIKAMGATMRLGAYKALIRPGTLAHKLYGKDSVTERHRHRYEFNPAYRDELENAGLVISAVNDEHGLVEVVELPDHPFFIACQYHPEFQSAPNRAHPLFSGLVSAALEHKSHS